MSDYLDHAQSLKLLSNYQLNRVWLHTLIRAEGVLNIMAGGPIAYFLIGIAMVCFSKYRLAGITIISTVTAMVIIMYLVMRFVVAPYCDKFSKIIRTSVRMEILDENKELKKQRKSNSVQDS